ncbi:MAG: hypothetical protein FWC34_09075 [Bacteroidetes bacterium]|nr:hypothetical protein [Bacteroidota bacterium]
MKKLLGFITIVAIFVAGILSLGAATPTGIGLLVAGSGTVLMDAGAALTLDTQKIVFLRSLKEEYDAIETWMNEAEDLSMFVSEGQTLVFPEAGADPSVYKNRISDIDSVEPEETVHKVELDVYDSQNYKIRNALLHALPFEKVQYYTKKSADAIIKKEVQDTAYAWAPKQSGNKISIQASSGPARGGYKMLTLDDIVALARDCDNKEFPDGRNLVLPSDMWWDLVNNNEILKGQLKNLTPNGTIKPTMVEYYGFKIHKSLGDKLGIGWDVAQNKLAPQGALIGGNVVPCALLFCKSEVFRAGGMYEMFYLNKSQNPTGRAYEFGFQHRFKSDFQMSANRYSGLIYLAKA